MVSGHRNFLVGSSVAGKAPQAGGETPPSLEIGVSKNTPHSSLKLQNHGGQIDWSQLLGFE